MKENELRIGNYIRLYRRPDDKNMTNHKVKSIFLEETNEPCYHIELEDGFLVNIDTGIVPIPLTEKILRSIGYYEIGKNNLTYFALQKKSKYYIIRGFKKIKFRYLHEFQNFYFVIMGKELEINLL